MIAAHLDISACALCLCDATRKAARAVSSVYDHSLAPYGIRISQFTILAALELRGPMPLGELAKFLQLDRTTLTRNLALLEENKWVRSRPAARDSRSRVLVMTNEGRTAVFSAFPAWREAQARVATVVRDNDVAFLTRLSDIPRLP